MVERMIPQRELQSEPERAKANKIELTEGGVREVLTGGDYNRLCDRFAREGHPYKGTVTHMCLKRFLRWAKSHGYVKQNVLIGSTVEYEQRTRDRVYSDDEIKAIWKQHCPNDRTFFVCARKFAGGRRIGAATIPPTRLPDLSQRRTG